jgi:N-acetylglucosaminyldiphosphoundecaprenol N-acetyl-beta-D-mannosaminyltransferase
VWDVVETRVRWVRHSVGGLPLVATDRAGAVAIVCALAAAHRGTPVFLINANNIAAAATQPEVAACYLDPAAVGFPDGKPLTWLSRLLGQAPPLNHVYGPHLFRDTFAATQDGSVSHYLLGGKPEVLDRLVQRLAADYPGARVVGHESPPFRRLSPAEQQAEAERIRRAGADLDWVGLGSPKQDLVAARLAAALPVTAVAVGAAFDFAAGAAKQAPEWVRRAGLEWFYRLVHDPRRLWRRYTVGHARFLAAVWRHRHDPEPDATDLTNSSDSTDHN